MACYWIETFWEERGVVSATAYLFERGKKKPQFESTGPSAWMEALGWCNEELRTRGVDFRRWSKAIETRRMTARSPRFELEPYETI